MTDQEILKVVARVLGDRVPEAEFKGADVQSEIDFDGESVIRVTAHYARRPTASKDVLIDAMHDLRDELIAQGEDRFVFLTNDVETERQLEPDVD